MRPGIDDFDQAPDEAAPDVERLKRAEATSRARIEQLEGQLAALRAERDAAEYTARVRQSEQLARIREFGQLISTLSVALGATRADIERAAASRAWRYGHGASRIVGRLAMRRDKTDGALASALWRIEQVRLSTRALSPGSPAPAVSGHATTCHEGDAEPAVPGPLRPTAEIAAQRRVLAVEVRERLGAVPGLDTWPGVSIVVPNRGRREQLERLVDGLRERTDYPTAELVVVDNGSADDAAALLASCDAGIEVRLVANDDSASFSESCNQGATAAAHDLLLFLDDEIEPFERAWLRELVAAHVLGDHAATGATLLHTEERSAGCADGRLVQHLAIRMQASPDGVRPHSEGDGEDLFAAGFGVERAAPALSSACLLIDRDTLEGFGAFSSRFRDGMESVDLGLRLTDAGLRVVSTGRALVYHRESSQQHAEGADLLRANRLVNHRAFLERWGPWTRRAYRIGRIDRDPFWTDGRGPRAAITETSRDEAAGWGDWDAAHELGEALGHLGWRITYVARKDDGWSELPADLDYVVTLVDAFDARTVPADVTVVAWVCDWTERWLDRSWFERLDLVLASSRTSVELVERRGGRRPSLFPLATNPARFARREELPGIYASDKLVLDEAHEPTLRYDGVSARVFDALAAGAVPLSNCVAGIRELFGDDLPTWSSDAELTTVRDALLADDDRRSEIAGRLREIVLQHHTYAHRAHELVRLLREYESRPSFCIKIGAPDWKRAERWGDLHFARAIERELRRRGHRCLIQVLEEWEQTEGLLFDVVLHLRGRGRYHPKAGQLNVLWCISHPDECSGAACDGYDLVCVASESFAGMLRESTRTPVTVLEQATDPAVFFPDPDPDEAAHHDLVYVANSRNVLRPIARDLLPTEHDLAIFGANWNGLIDATLIRSEHVVNDELRRVYSSASIVLADHWDDMRAHGFISNRIYDALACGAFVISDDVPGLAERFGGSVAVYRTPAELRALIERYLADPAGRARRSARGRERVLAEHGFATRVDELLRLVEGATDQGRLSPRRLAEISR